MNEQKKENIVKGATLAIGCLWAVGVFAFWVLVLVALFNLATK